MCVTRHGCRHHLNVKNRFINMSEIHSLADSGGTKSDVMLRMLVAIHLRLRCSSPSRLWKEVKSPGGLTST